MDSSKIGKFIRELRIERKLSQTELAEKMHVTRSAISKWETGKGLPDSSMILIMKDIFDVSTDEILSGERKNNSIEENLALRLLDSYNKENKKTKKLKKIIITSFIIIFLLLLYYFIISYNSVKIFTINGSNESAYTRDGILIFTKRKLYLRLGETISHEKNIKKLKLYYLDRNNNENLIFENDKTDIFISTYFGYDEYFSYNDLENIKNNLYIQIIYDDNTLEKLKLNVKKDFSNNLFSYKKHIKSIRKDGSESKNKANELEQKYLKNLEKVGRKDDDGNIHYSISEENNNIIISYTEGIFTIVKDENVKCKMWNIITATNNVLYREMDGLEEKNFIQIDNYKKDLNKEEKDKVDDFINILDKYLN